MTLQCPNCEGKFDLLDLSAKSAEQVDEKPRKRWQGIITQLGVRAGKLDNRMISSVTWAELPLTLYAQTENSEGHNDAKIVGNIDQIWIDGQNVMGSGLFSNSDEGQNALQQVGEGNLKGISVDIRDGDLEISEELEEDGTMSVNWVKAHLGAATLVGKPAFEHAIIEILEEGALKASVGPHKYDRAMFAPIKYKKAQRVKISDDGELTGHIVVWGERHRGFGNKIVTLHPTRKYLRNFNIGTANFTDGGSMATGILTSDGLHAPDKLNANNDLARAMEVQAFTQSELTRHEDVRCQFAQVYAYEDKFGIAVHGSLLPDVTVAQATRALAGCTSIDYRNHKFMGAHFVNTCGFLPPAIDGEENIDERLVASAYGDGSSNCKDCDDDKSQNSGRIVNLNELREAEKRLQAIDKQMESAKLASILASKNKSK